MHYGGLQPDAANDYCALMKLYRSKHAELLNWVKSLCYEPEQLIGKTLIAITNLPPRPMMGVDSCGMLLSAIHKEEGEEKLHLLMVDDHIPAGAKLY